MLPSQVVCILNFFDIWGYNSGVSKLSKYRRVADLITTVHIALVVIFTIYTIRLTILLSFWLRAIEVINDSMQLALGIYTHLAVIFDSIFSQREHQHFWKTLQFINTRFCQNRQIQLQNWLLTFKAYLLIVDSVYLINYAYRGFEYTIDYAVYLALNTICQVRIFFYIFCLEILCFQLEVIKNELKISQGMTDFESVSFQFKRIREHYASVYEMTTHLNEVFGWSHVAITLYCFYKLLTEIITLYTYIQEESFAPYMGKYFRIFYFFRFALTFSIV